MPDLSSLQQSVLDTLSRSTIGGMATHEIAHRLGCWRIAVTAACKALERRGMVGSIRSYPGDRWSALHWFRTEGVRDA